MRGDFVSTSEGFETLPTFAFEPMLLKNSSVAENPLRVVGFKPAEVKIGAIELISFSVQRKNDHVPPPRPPKPWRRRESVFSKLNAPRLASKSFFNMAFAAPIAAVSISYWIPPKSMASAFEVLGGSETTNCRVLPSSTK